MTFELGASGVTAAGDGEAEPPPAPVIEASDEFSPEIDLRGQTLDEALSNLGAFLDRAALGSAERLTVIHGKGTGTLRRGVGDFLRNRPEVAEFRLGQAWEGGDGVTVVRVKR